MASILDSILHIFDLHKQSAVHSRGEERAPVAVLQIMSGLVQGWPGKKRCAPCQIAKMTAEEQEILSL